MRLEPLRTARSVVLLCVVEGTSEHLDLFRPVMDLPSAIVRGGTLLQQLATGIAGRADV